MVASSPSLCQNGLTIREVAMPTPMAGTYDWRALMYEADPNLNDPPIVYVFGKTVFREYPGTGIFGPIVQDSSQDDTQ